jgi:hypothetical protein
MLLLFALAVGFNWPYLTAGFQGDDLILINLIDGEKSSFSRWLGVWAVNDWPGLNHLWWKDWQDMGDARVFWRPLPSLILESSLWLFGKNPFPLHLLSLLVHGAVVILLFRLIRRFSRSTLLGFLSGLFFVSCEDHSMGVGWIAAVTDLLCVLFALGALNLQVEWLRSRRWRFYVGMLLALILALACKETASVVPLAMVMLVFFLPDGGARGLTGEPGFKTRVIGGLHDLRSWLPLALVLLVYLALYQLLRLGSLDSLGYTSPFANPGGYITRLVEAVPILWLGTLSVVPPFLATIVSEWQIYMAVGGLLLFVAWVLALGRWKRFPAVMWALLVYLLALLPQVSADVSERGLYLAMVPASFLLACLASGTGFIAGRSNFQPVSHSRLRSFIGWAVCFFILFPGATGSAISPWVHLPFMDKPLAEIRTAMPHIERSGDDRVVLMNTSGYMHTLYTWDAVNFLSDHPREVWTLSSAGGVFTVERTGESKFVLSTDRSGWLNNFFARIIRVRSGFDTGQEYRTSRFTATILRLTPSGTDILSAQFEFDESLDMPGTLFLRWNGREFVPLDVASLPLAEAMVLADTPDPWAGLFEGL